MTLPEKTVRRARRRQNPPEYRQQIGISLQAVCSICAARPTGGGANRSVEISALSQNREIRKMNPNLISLLIDRCGLSQSEAAAFLKISPSSVDKMSRGIRRTPDGVVDELAALYERIDATARQIMQGAAALAQKGADPGDRIVVTMTDMQAREKGWPCAAPANAAVGIAAALSEHDFMIDGFIKKARGNA
jgi:predicted transcriptional regulator